MIHARKDYDRFQDPALADPSLLGEGSTPIGEDEPVMLFRAHDKFFVRVLEFYDKLLIDAGKEDMSRAMDLQIRRAISWRDVHGSKTPDIPDGSGQ